MLKPQSGIRTAVAALAFAFLMQLQLAPRVALAAGTACVGEQAMIKDVGLLENRFFARQYTNDPIEKRLERLELMVFGGTQDGENGQRLSRLKKAVADRAEQAAKTTTATKPGAAGAEKKTETSTQYPVLNTLEWRALKKTYPQESLDQRLARLEKKLFGADSPSMAYVDRVDRLKRTLGIGVTVAQQPTGPLGPAPKARPRGQQGPEVYGFGMPPMMGMLPGMGGDDMYGDEGITPPSFGFGFGLNSSLNSMFRDMERQMQQLQQLPPGSYTYDPKSGAWIEQNTGKRLKPFGSGGKPTPSAPVAPPAFKTPKIAPSPLWHNDTDIPPYSDPNSI